MIHLTCAQCQATFEVDDAFAGGVCRCQQCGTIQTVPRVGGRPQEPGVAGPGGPAEAPRALYQAQSRSGGSSAPSGLEELAEVIHSSGLGGSGLRNTRGPIAAGAVKKNKVPLVAAIVGGAVVLIVAAAVAISTLRPPAPVATPSDGPPLAPVADTATPNFAGIPLGGDRTIFVLDRGDATADFFNGLKVITDRAVVSLGPDRKFQVVLWDNGSVDSFPALAPGYCTPEEAAKLSAWFDDVATGRPTDAIPALKAAIARSPDTIVLVTAKSNQLADSSPTFAGDVLALLGGKKIVIHTVTLGDSTPADPLKKIAMETSGRFLILTHGDLDRLAG